MENQIRILNDEMIKLRTEKATVEAKLKEAVSARPGEADPREAAKAGEHIKALEKERDLQKLSLEQNAKAMAALTKEKQSLQSKVDGAGDNKAQFAALRAENDGLKKQLAETQKSSSTAPKNAEAAKQLSMVRGENEMLKRQVSELSKGSSAQPKLDEANKRLGLVQKENESLKHQVSELGKSSAAGPKLEEVSRKLSLVQNENDILKHQMADQNKKAASAVNARFPAQAPYADTKISREARH